MRDKIFQISKFFGTIKEKEQWLSELVWKMAETIGQKIGKHCELEMGKPQSNPMLANTEKFAFKEIENGHYWYQIIAVRKNNFIGADVKLLWNLSNPHELILQVYHYSRFQDKMDQWVSIFFMITAVIFSSILVGGIPSLLVVLFALVIGCAFSMLFTKILADPMLSLMTKKFRPLNHKLLDELYILATNGMNQALKIDKNG